MMASMTVVIIPTNKIARVAILIFSVAMPNAYLLVGNVTVIMTVSMAKMKKIAVSQIKID